MNRQIDINQILEEINKLPDAKEYSFNIKVTPTSDVEHDNCIIEIILSTIYKDKELTCRDDFDTYNTDTFDIESFIKRSYDLLTHMKKIYDNK